MQRLEAWGTPHDRFKVLLNRGARGNQIKQEEVSQAVNQEIFWEVPQDKKIPPSVQLGQPVVFFNDGCPAARNLLALSRLIAGTKKPLVQHKKKSMISNMINR